MPSGLVPNFTNIDSNAEIFEELIRQYMGPGLDVKRIQALINAYLQHRKLDSRLIWDPIDLGAD